MLTGVAETVHRSRRLRKDMTLPEVVLWTALRTRPAGLKFRRQHPAGLYTLDFFCASAKLAVEVDGEAHGRGDRPVKDERRDAWLTSEGVHVLRLPATLILRDLDAAVAAIVAAGARARPLHQPSAGSPPRSGEE